MVQPARRRVRLRLALKAHPVQNLALAGCFALCVVAGWVGFEQKAGTFSQVLVYRVVVLAALASTVLFVAVYSKLAAWWRNPIGRSIVAVDAAVFLALLPIALSLFFTFSRLTSEIASGLDLAAVTAIPVTMCWRIYAWLRLPRLPGHGNGGPE